tara:strand:- start:3354 stop:3851 length:498 start_codon:yes stop_codon:yes gene_type:complete
MTKGFKVWDNNYDSEVNPTKYPKGKEMPLNWATGKKINGKLIWRPAVIGVNPPFDQTIQTRTLAHVMEDSQITIDYTVTDNNLFNTKQNKKLEAKQIGKGLLLAKNNVEDQRNAALGILTAGEITTIKNDINTIRNYYKNDFVPAVNACTTVQEVKAVSINFPPI